MNVRSINMEDLRRARGSTIFNTQKVESIRARINRILETPLSLKKKSHALQKKKRKKLTEEL